MKKHTHFMILLASSIILIAVGCSIKDAPVCIKGDEQCSEDIMNIGVYQVCLESGKWGQSFSCGVACDGKQCGENELFSSCENEGEIRCMENEGKTFSLTCLHKNWIPQYCRNNQCSNDKGCTSDVSCEEGSTVCTEFEDVGLVQAECINGGWRASYCQRGWICVNNRCVEPPQVEDCHEICDLPNSTSITCENKQCKATACDDGYHLFDDKCEKNDENNCGSHGTVCDSSVVPDSQDVECSQAGVCIAKSCQSGYHLYDNGCEKDDTVNCGNHDAACTKDLFEGSETVSCNTGICTIDTCDGSHILTGNSCIERNCTNNTEKCINDGVTGKMYKCIDNAMQEQSICQGNHSCNADGTACGECINNDKKCIDTNNIGKVYTCSDGSWGTGVSCSTKSCNSSGTACGACSNTSTSCSNYTSGSYKGIGRIRECINGSWGSSNECADNASCKNSSDCGVCRDGAMQCSGTKSQKCVSGSWQDQYDCNPSHGSGSCSGEGVCSFICDTGYCPDGNECVNNMDSNVHHCGGCGNDCYTMITGAKEAKCVSGVCQMISCTYKYHLYNGACEENTWEHCGDHDTNCHDVNMSTCCSCDEGYSPEGSHCAGEYPSPNPDSIVMCACFPAIVIDDD